MAREKAGEKRGQVVMFPSCTVDVWITEDELAELKRDAAREGVTLSTFVRRFVSEEVDRLRAARRKKRFRPTIVRSPPCASDSSPGPADPQRPNR